MKGLANNAAFQRFAVRSSQQVQEASRAASEVAKSLSQHQTIAQIRGESSDFRKRAMDFATALGEELQQIARQGTGQIDKKPPTPPQGR